MILGFTGTEKGMTVEQAHTVQRLMKELDTERGAIFHHGDCVGSDDQAHVFAEEQHCYIEVHPPENPRKRAFCTTSMGYVHAPLPYFQRNRAIVDAARDGVIAAPRTKTEVLRSGTWGTVRYARKIGRKLWIVYPDGTLKEENMEARLPALRDS
jgi:hypothetical protein